MGYYLLERPTRRKNWYTTRRGPILAFVIHGTAGLEDLDGHDDHSAEATARYAATTDRQASWHSGSDSDSHLALLPDSYTAFHCKGYNSRTLGHEISKKHTDWRPMPKEWVEKTLLQAARSVAPRAKKHGIPFRKISKAQLDAGVKGFISHWELDPPPRRTDVGLADYVPHRNPGVDTFPWARFFELCHEVVGEKPPTPPPPVKKPPSGLPRTIRRGSKAKATVELLQKRLINHGHNIGRVDGIFGPRTEEAVKRHQRAWRLNPDGIVGPATWPSLLAKGPSGT